MNKKFTEKLLSKLKKNIRQVNYSLREIFIDIRSNEGEKSSPDPLDISFMISSKNLMARSEILDIVKEESFQKLYDNVVRSFKRNFKSVKEKDKKISIDLKIAEYDDILKSYEKDFYDGYCGDVVFLEAHIYNPALEALNLLINV